ncbi:hypothetical protein LOTGIDRAFT_154152 [Lottia gigantea]|uniref:Uncharacterized protein n=1 Tax=Lottia gigantea TaxID=225164 RepID=V4A2B5_LOTGI|nr:hypothetical protein LOTGIDRAFT_154152 [Lottia gigantea]ESO89075.1 hypothetical protein LOTGIDRAFT_154152 [Lottia gigantea]
MVLSIVQASEDTSYYLLTANLGISSIIGIVVVSCTFQFFSMNLHGESFSHCTVHEQRLLHYVKLLRTRRMPWLHKPQKMNWWYRGGDLAVDKYWFIIVVALVLSFQSIMTDIFVFHGKQPVEAITTTLSPGNRTTPITMVTIRNNTNKTLINNLMTTPTVVYYLH